MFITKNILVTYNKVILFGYLLHKHKEGNSIQKQNCVIHLKTMKLDQMSIVHCDST